MLAAVENNNSDVINLLISAGADYDVTDRVSAVFIQYLFTNHYLYFDNSLSYIFVISVLSSWYES